MPYSKKTKNKMFISNSFDDAEGYWDLCVNWQFNFSHKKKKNVIYRYFFDLIWDIHRI